MLTTVKTWLLEVALKKLVPSLLRGALAAMAAFLMAHANVLAHFGVSYDSAKEVLSVDFGTLKVILGSLMVGGIASALRLVQHHTEATVKGEPQAGA